MRSDQVVKLVLLQLDGMPSSFCELACLKTATIVCADVPKGVLAVGFDDEAYVERAGMDGLVAKANVANNIKDKDTTWVRVCRAILARINRLDIAAHEMHISAISLLGLHCPNPTVRCVGQRYGCDLRSFGLLIRNWGAGAEKNNGCQAKH